MNTEFCMKCGAKAEFSLKAPNFCPSCGEPFNRAATVSETAAPTIETVEEALEASEERVPRLAKLEYSIGDSAGGVTFGDLINEAAGSNLPYEKADPRPTPQGEVAEDIIQQTMNECRSVREPQDVSDG